MVQNILKFNLNNFDQFLSVGVIKYSDFFNMKNPWKIIQYK